MYKAVFLDLDGTVLDDEKNISNINIKAIERAKSKGALICVCSGRQIDITREFKDMIHASDYMICSNGAIIYDDNAQKELYASYINTDFCKKVFDYCEANGIVARYDTKEGRYVNNEKINVSTEMLITEGMDTFLNNNNIIQVSIAGKNYDEINKAIEDLDLENSDSITIGNKYSEDYPFYYCAFNCLNKDVSKGNAIKELCKCLNITTDEVIAMGDELNDISMLEVAGLGVAMGNALDEVKAVANEITKTNTENGVAHILDKYI